MNLYSVTEPIGNQVQVALSPCLVNLLANINKLIGPELDHKRRSLFHMSLTIFGCNRSIADSIVALLVRVANGHCN